MKQTINQIKAHKYIYFLLLLSVLFTGLYMNNTLNQVKTIGPDGDSQIYAFMTVEFIKDKFSEEKLPSLYAQRIFMPLITASAVKILVKDSAKTAAEVKTPRYVRTVNYHEFIIKINTVWRLINAALFALSLVMMFLIMRHYSIPEKNAFFILCLFGLWVPSYRLYFFWSFMTDVGAMAFMITSIYFMLKRKYLGFMLFAAVAFITKEQTLQVLCLVFPFVLTTEKQLKLNKRILLALGICVLPAVPYILLRISPVFNEINYTPNGMFNPELQYNAWQKKIMDITGYTNNFFSNRFAEPQTHVEGASYFKNYITILVHHFVLKLRPAVFAAVTLMPFSVFAGVFPFIMLNIKTAFNFLKQNKCWVFFALSFAAYIFSDRYIIMMAPLVLILGGICSKNLSEKNFGLLMAPTIIIAMFQCGLFIYAKPGFAEKFLLDYLETSTIIRTAVYTFIMFTAQICLIKLFKRMPAKEDSHKNC